MFKLSKEIDGELKTVNLDNPIHVAAFVKEGWDAEEVDEEEVKRPGRPAK